MQHITTHPNYRYWSERVTRLGLMLGLGLVVFAAWKLCPNQPAELTFVWALVTGLLTGVHCTSMCGGFVLAYATRKQASATHHVHYALAKTLSYSMGGAFFGALGQLVSFSSGARGLLGLLAGVALLGYALARTLPPFRRKCGCASSCRVGRVTHPLLIGLFNGMMVICGPLQAMYLAAAATANPLHGAGLLFCFGLGTLPMLLGFGWLATLLKQRFQPFLHKAGSFLMMLFALLMIQQGLALAGFNLKAASAEPAENQGSVQIVRMRASQAGYSPQVFVVQTGIPVTWLIQVDQLTTCNQQIVIPALQIDHQLVAGENRINFLPKEPGTLAWSCWMGMLRGQFQVVAGSAP